MSEVPLKDQPAKFPDSLTEFAEECEKIRSWSHEDCARLWRFAPPGHPWFTCDGLWAEFKAHFFKLGGFTVEISKRIGWDAPAPKFSTHSYVDKRGNLKRS